MSAITLDNVEKRFADGRPVVAPLTLSIAAGDFVSILGPSGCGKSTLLRLIAGLDQPTVGRVSVDANAAASFVFQDAHLLPWRDVVDNVALPLELRGIDKSERRDRARRALQQVGLIGQTPPTPARNSHSPAYPQALPEIARLYPSQLSGGMRMRVSLARALVAGPTLLLLDEPFAALDEITRQHLDDLLRRLWQTTGLTVLFVTHSIAEAAYLADRVIVLSRRPARVMLDTRPDLPAERDAELRTSAAFAEQTRTLFHALHRGESA